VLPIKCLIFLSLSTPATFALGPRTPGASCPAGKGSTLAVVIYLTVLTPCDLILRLNAQTRPASPQPFIQCGAFTFAPLRIVIDANRPFCISNGFCRPAGLPLACPSNARVVPCKGQPGISPKIFQGLCQIRHPSQRIGLRVVRVFQRFEMKRHDLKQPACPDGRPRLRVTTRLNLHHGRDHVGVQVPFFGPLIDFRRPIMDFFCK